MATAPTRRTPAAQPSILDQIGATTREAFPNISAVAANLPARVKANIAAGDYARAAGNGAGGMVAYPAAAATDLVARPAISLVRGAGNFLGGVLGSDGSKVVRAAPALAAPAAVVPARDAVDNAFAQGRNARVSLTPQDQLGAYISSVLSNGATIREVEKLGSLVPALAKPGQSTKNTVLGETAKLSDAIHQDQLEKINAAVKAGTITADQGTIGAEKATAAYFARNAGLVGFDPTKLALAQQMQPDEDQ